MDSEALTIPAGDFKARCLALLDQVKTSGRSLIITKHGEPVARLVPIVPPKSLLGSVTIHGDLLQPLDEDWDANT